MTSQRLLAVGSVRDSTLVWTCSGLEGSGEHSSVQVGSQRRRELVLWKKNTQICRCFSSSTPLSTAVDELRCVLSLDNVSDA
jgi:hypothetical protein